MSAMDKNLVYNQADEVHRQLDELVRPHEPQEAEGRGHHDGRFGTGSRYAFLSLGKLTF